jgi:hypothetical protein
MTFTEKIKHALANLDIIAGAWYTDITGQLFGYEERVAKVAAERLLICSKCENRNHSRCGLCGCPVRKLAVSSGPNENLCTANKWKEIINL